MGTTTRPDLEEGTADPRVEARLRVLCDLPEPDAALLARLIAGIAKTDFAPTIDGWDAERRRVRKAALSRLKKLQAAAVELLELESGIAPDILADAVSDLVIDEQKSPTVNAERLVAIIRELAAFDITADLRKFGTKQKVDARIAAIVLAVGTYFRRRGMRFTGAPRKSMTEEGSVHIIKSEQAQLTDGVLQIMGLNISPAKLATFMNKARKQLNSG